MAGAQTKSPQQLAATERRKRQRKNAKARLEKVASGAKVSKEEIAKSPEQIKVARQANIAIATAASKAKREQRKAQSEAAEKRAVDVKVRAEVAELHARLDAGEQVGPEHAVAPVMRRVLNGEPLDKALEPALPFAAARLLRDLASPTAVGSRAAEQIIERVAGKPVQPVRQEGPVTIVFLTGALPPEDQAPPLEIEDAEWEPS